jgi:hypothetical protein
LAPNVKRKTVPAATGELLSETTIMEKKTATATADTAYGKKLETPITFDYSWTSYATVDEVRAADKWPNDRKIVKMVTAMAKAAGRSAGQAAAFEAAGIIKPTAENDPQVALKDMARTLALQKNADGTRKFTDEEVRKRASLALGIEWADEDEDTE